MPVGFIAELSRCCLCSVSLIQKHQRFCSKPNQASLLSLKVATSSSGRVSDVRALARRKKKEDFDPSKEVQELSALMPDPGQEDELFDTAGSDNFLDDDFLNEFGDLSKSNFSNFGAGLGEYALGSYGSTYAQPQEVLTQEEMQELAQMQWDLDFAWAGKRLAYTRDAQEMAMECHHHLAENCSNRFAMTLKLAGVLEEMSQQDEIEGPSDDVLPPFIRSYYLMYDMFEMLDPEYRKRKQLEAQGKNYEAVMLEKFARAKEYNLENRADMRRFVQASTREVDSSNLMKRIMANRRLEHRTAYANPATPVPESSRKETAPGGGLDDYLAQIMPGGKSKGGFWSGDASSNADDFMEDILGPTSSDTNSVTIDVEAEVKPRD